MPAKKAPTFEQALERLETIASGLEDGSMSLEESLKAYEEGVALIRACEKTLASARLRIKDQDDPVQDAPASESAPDKSI